eukprot:CAMPEP_0171299346 /NCGR_PEP_ID=MMETSP0816-20121228/8161_1 /TAXON_ID=420281 /ORGANISM="Proboscia inermis, Strain CCAP1064/1" /LENGTH=76 /DNA_ID=CAMNT_0011775069 /DNA_START=112 /DNA_END=339 /DNA_ORIENTATION=+
MTTQRFTAGQAPDPFPTLSKKAEIAEGAADVEYRGGGRILRSGTGVEEGHQPILRSRGEECWGCGMEGEGGDFVRV